MAQAFGIVSFAGNNIRVGEMQNYRPVGAVSFLGRYRVIDFPISNMSNSEIEHIQVYVRRKPRSLTEHLGTGRHYNINSKSGRLHILYSDFANAEWSVYNNDLAAYEENMECFIHRIMMNYLRHILNPVQILPCYITVWIMQKNTI